MFGWGQGKGLAVVAILIGLNAPAQAGETLYASLGDTTRSPIGWVEFCADNPGDCRGRASQPRDIVMSQTAWRDLVRVNKWVNETRQADDRHGSLGHDREMVAADQTATATARTTCC